jgi:hypothetical protein
VFIAICLSKRVQSNFEVAQFGSLIWPTL